MKGLRDSVCANDEGPQEGSGSCYGGGARSRLVDAELRTYKGRKAGVSEVAMYIPTPKPTLPYQR